MLHSGLGSGINENISTGRPPSLQGHTSAAPTFPGTGWRGKGGSQMWTSALLCKQPLNSDQNSLRKPGAKQGHRLAFRSTAWNPQTRFPGPCYEGPKPSSHFLVGTEISLSKHRTSRENKFSLKAESLSENNKTDLHAQANKCFLNQRSQRSSELLHHQGYKTANQRWLRSGGQQRSSSSPRCPGLHGHLNAQHDCLSRHTVAGQSERLWGHSSSSTDEMKSHK